MEPPPYMLVDPNNETVHYPITWDEIVPFITPQNITPRTYHALQIVVQNYSGRLIKGQCLTRKETSVSDKARTNSLMRWTHILSKILWTFSMSIFPKYVIVTILDYLLDVSTEILLEYIAYKEVYEKAISEEDARAIATVLLRRLALC